MAIFKIRLEPESIDYQTNYPDICNSLKVSQLTVIQYESKIRNIQLRMFNPLYSLVWSCITPYSDLISTSIRLAFLHYQAAVVLNVQ